MLNEATTRTLWAAMKSTVIELVDSKKAVMAVLAMIALFAAKLGFEMDTAAAYACISPVLLQIASQAHVDAAAAKRPAVTATLTDAVDSSLAINSPPESKPAS